MFTDLSKNTPEDLEKLFQFVGRSAERVEDKDLKIWSAWMSTIRQAMKDSEFQQNQLPFNTEVKLYDLKF